MIWGRDRSLSAELGQFFASRYMNRLSEAQRIALGVLGTYRVDDLAIITATPLMTKVLTRAMEHKRKRGRVRRGTIAGRKLSIVNPGVGAPATALHTRALAHAGASTVIRIEFCGALCPDLALGDRFLVTEAVGFDGVTDHYRPDASTHTPDRDLYEGLVRLLEHYETGSEREAARRFTTHRGTICTVDIFATDTDFYREKAAVGAAIDMETSALFAMGKVHDLATAALLLVSDAPLHGTPLYADDYPYGRMLDGLKALTATVEYLVPRVGESKY